MAWPFIITRQKRSTAGFHCQAGGAGTETTSEPDPIPRCIIPGVLPSTLRASLKLFKIAPGDFVAPNSKHRVDVTPAKRCKGNPAQSQDDKTPEQRRQGMTWAQRLKRVFNIDVSICPKCGGESKVIASIEDQAVKTSQKIHDYQATAID